MVLCNLFPNMSFRVKKLKFQIKNVKYLPNNKKNAQFQICYIIVNTAGNRKIKGYKMKLKRLETNYIIC